MAIYVRRLGTQGIFILLPPEAGHDVEACLREPNILNRTLRADEGIRKRIRECFSGVSSDQLCFRPSC